MINESIKDYMHEFIVDICKNIGPRESGTQQEIDAGNRIEDELKKFCDETHQEEYVSSPHAFLGGIRYGAFLVLFSIILFWLSLLGDLGMLQIDIGINFLILVVGVLIMVITFSYFILEVMFYHETFDFLFPKRMSKNIIGTINPTEEVKNTIIFSAHHDSAFEFNTFYYLKRAGQIIINIGYLGAALVFIGTLCKLIFLLLSIDLLILFLAFGVIFLIFIPITFVYVFFHSYKAVEGAFDNLSAVAVLLGIGKMLSQNKNNEIFPKHTRIHLISFAGEECGLRGSKRYVTKHYDELIENGTITVNMESIGNEDVLIVINKETLIGAKHSVEMNEVLFKIASNLNKNAKLGPLPFGATDAAVFSKKNLPATTIGGLNLTEELPPFYHTRKDKPEVVEKGALGQILQICLEYLNHVDDSKKT